MSTKTRREKRNAAAALPVQTDWLWSCPPDMPLGEIARRLGFTREPRTELSVQAWTDERRLRDDLYQAFVPDIPLSQLVPYVVWDAFDEHLLDACADGRLIVLRDLPPEVPRAVQMLLDIVGFRRRERDFHFFESQPGARFALVLAGWPEATIRIRSRYTTRYTVQALGGAASPS
jgi:hypothetical protein